MTSRGKSPSANDARSRANNDAPAVPPMCAARPFAPGEPTPSSPVDALFTGVLLGRRNPSTWYGMLHPKLLMGMGGKEKW